ncbi:MAG: helix-turn-helix transcriptional regulator [Lachnospiraceae bacterium]|nr:helix-turn-helix transcriptional regulator [Lachnospiraceae bacterium]
MELIFYDMKSRIYQKSGGIPTTPLRTVTCYEIEYQVSDGGTSYINGEAYPIRAGQMLLAKPGMRRCTNGSYSCVAMHFKCRDQGLSEKMNRLPHTLMPLNPARAEELLRIAYNSRMDVESRSLRLEGILLEILAEYMDASGVTERVLGEYRAYADGVYRTVEYMQKNYGEHITSELLAKQMFISTNFYQRVFKQIMGVPPAQFLRDIRVSEACRLLANTDMSVQEIAEKCGFNCASYFIYVIKKQLGVTPLEYRKTNRMLL